MDVQPIVVPIKLFRIPREKLLLIFANAIEQRPHVVATEYVRVLDGEGEKHLKRFRRFARLLLDSVDGLLDALDDAFVAAATPTRLCAIEQVRSLLCRLIH